MRAKYVFIILSFLVIHCSKFAAQERWDYNQSKKLIERYNKLRLEKGISIIHHDTILDNNAKILLTYDKYKKNDKYYIADSIRNLLYKSGITDYQYEIIELYDKDTLSCFNKLFLADKTKNIQMGYARHENNQIIIKTKKFLKFEHGEVACHTNIIDPLGNNKSISITTDSIHYFLNRVIPENYYYAFFNEIPLSSQDVNFKNKKTGKII